MGSSALQLSSAMNTLAAASSSMAPVISSSGIAVRLDSSNFPLWKGLMLPHLAGSNLHAHLDGDVAAPEKTVTEKGVTSANPEYHPWWVQDQRVKSILLGSMDGVIATQMIGCETAAAVWKAVNTMYGAQSRANVRHIRRLLQSTRKEDMSAAAFMHKMKGFADTMAAAGAPITDDELVDPLLTGLGSAYNAIAANYTVGNKSVSYSEFYSHVLSFEAL